MTFSLWRNAEWQKDVKAAYRLWRWINQTKNGVITGLPGTKKTLRTLLAVSKFGDEYGVVFAAPLRQLRDDIVRRFGREPLSEFRSRVVRIRAHDEVCPPLRERMADGMSYWEALGEHFRAALAGEEECGWRSEMKKAIDAMKNRKIIVTTHTIGIVLFLAAKALRLKKVLFFFDEGDDLLLTLNEPLSVADLEILKEIAPQRWKRIMRLAEFPTKYKGKGAAFFLDSRLVHALMKSAFFITATWPRSITEWFRDYEDWEIPEYRMRTRPSNDLIIISNEELWHAATEAWWRRLAPQLLEIAGAAIRRFGAVGIIARSKENNLRTAELLEKGGYSVWSDARDENRIDYRDAEVVIITTLGKGYRGINFFSRRTGGDFPVIVAFFQARANDIKHPLFHFMFVDDPDEESEMSKFVRDLLYAKNVQALFRFNRYRSRKHLLILLDARWWSALNAYAHYYYRLSNVVKTDLDRLAETAVPLIRGFSPE